MDMLLNNFAFFFTSELICAFSIVVLLNKCSCGILVPYELKPNEYEQSVLREKSLEVAGIKPRTSGTATKQADY